MTKRANTLVRALCGLFAATLLCVATWAPAAAKTAEPKSDYVVLVSAKTKARPEWAKVADALAKKRNAATLTYNTSPTEIQAAIRKQAPRMMAVVVAPEEIDYILVNTLHRVTRQIDDDPYGDCIWGIVTGYGPEDAMRIVQASAPLTISRAEATTNIDWKRFSDSLVITDWGPYEVMQQSGYKEPVRETLPETPQGMAFLFADYWKEHNPQLIVTSSHATQYNLEMPFGKGILVSYGNRLHVLNMAQFKQYASFLKGVLFEGREDDLGNFIEQEKAPVLEPNADPKVWVAAGNCLFGDAKKSRNTMVVTCLSAYGCNQVVGYTVPSWYGLGGWGSLDLFFRNTDSSSLAESWYLNNQFLLYKTQKDFPGLMGVEFNAPDMKSLQEMDPGFQKRLHSAGHGVGKDQMGLVHDRDTVAFYGDPAWVARLDESHEKSPWHVVWKTSGHPEDGFVIRANIENKGRFAIWFPVRLNVKKATLIIGETERPIEEVGVLTNDFLLIEDLQLPRGGEARVVFESPDNA